LNDMSDAHDKTAALLATLWLKNRPIVDERLALLDGAAAAATAGSLADVQRKEAQSAAHKLAGALGMYGFDEGTRVARQIEVLLDDGAPEPARLRALIAELRAAVFPAG
jgi:HPt (histidine-containing phosphotransfer) domain-containing protein